MYFAHDVVMYHINLLGLSPWYHGDSPSPLESAVRGLVSPLFPKFPKIFLLLLYCLKNKTKVFKLNYTRVYGNSVIRGNNGITPLSKIYCPLPFKSVKKINNSLLMPTSSLTPCLLRSNYKQTSGLHFYDLNDKCICPRITTCINEWRQLFPKSNNRFPRPKQTLSRFSTPSWRVGKRVTNYSVCMRN